MLNYTVVQLIQSHDTSNDPVEVTFYAGPDHAKAISALVMASVPESDAWYSVLSVTLTFKPI